MRVSYYIDVHMKMLNNISRLFPVSPKKKQSLEFRFAAVCSLSGVILAFSPCSFAQAPPDNAGQDSGVIDGTNAVTNYPNGIQYNPTNGGFELTSDNAAVTISDGTVTGNGTIYLNANSNSNQTVNLERFDTINISNAGVRAVYSRVAGFTGDTVATMGVNADATSGGVITVAGTGGAGGLQASLFGASSGNATTELHAGSIEVQNATNGYGLRATVSASGPGAGDARVEMTGGSVLMSSVNQNATAVFVSSANQGTSATGTVSGGVIETRGVGSYGVRVRHDSANGIAGTASATANISGAARIFTSSTSASAADASYAVYVTVGINAEGDAVANLSGGDLDTSAAASHGVFVSHSNSGASGASLINTSVATALTVDTAGDGARAAFVRNSGAGNSVIDAQAGTFMTGGGSAEGLFALSDGAGSSTVTLGTAAIANTSGDNSHGVLSSVNGVGSASVLASGQVSTSGASAHALMAEVDSAQAGNATVTLTGGTYSASGTDASGIVALMGSGTYDVNVTGGASITATGSATTSTSPEGGFAVHTAGVGGGTIDIDASSTISASGTDVAIRDGDRNFSGADDTVLGGGNVIVTTLGTINGGAVLGLGNDTFNLQGGTMTGTITGDELSGPTTDDGDDIFNWTGGSLTGGFAGQGGSDLVNISGAAAYDGTQTLDGGDDLNTVDTFTDVLTLDGISVGTAAAPADLSLIQNFETFILENGATLNATGDLAVGEIDPSTGLDLRASTLNILSNSFTLNGNLVNDGDSFVNLQSGGGSGSFSISGNVNNDGAISMQEGNAGDVLNIGGTFGGAGTIAIDVDYSSPTTAADTVIIAGAVSGTTTLNVQVTGTPGADGQVLLVNSTTDSITGGQFAITGAPGGAVYSLEVQGGDVFLVVDVEEPPAIPPANPGAPSVVPPAAPLAFVATAETITAEGLVSQLASMERMKSLRQRLGDIVGNEQALQRAAAGKLWAQYQGSFNDNRGSSQGAFHDTELTEFDFGGNVGVGSYASGTLLVGLSGHYARAQTTSNMVSLRGRSETDGAGLGAELVWVGDTGFYADAKIRNFWFESDAYAAGGSRFGMDSTLFQVSAEVGQRFELGDRNWITPQVQLRYSHLSADSQVVSGNTVALTDGSALTGRIGFDLGHTSDNGKTSIWVTTSLIAELNNGTEFRYGNQTLNPNPDDLLFEFGVGGSYNVSEALQLYGEIIGGTGLGSSGDDDYIGGNAGVKVAF